MKRTILFTFITLLALNFSFAKDLTPYVKVGTTTSSIDETAEKIVDLLKDKSFTVFGVYNPENNKNLKVITFTRNDLKNTVIKVKDRGALAAVLKIALVTKNGVTTISYTNPEYIFTAYLRDEYSKYSNVLTKVSSDLKESLSSLGNNFSSFGGNVDSEKLKKYHYKIMMPYFSEPIVLKEFNSFEEGLRVIEANLAKKKGQTSQVYKLIYTTEKVAVFGVGLENKQNGEAKFLPTIGQDHAAALPYEMILQGNILTMLHGKYRIALFWPELTMGTFMKIMSTPGDIEDTLKALAN
ncbi:MAG: hypothetical protein Q8S44_01980 [Flavobacteriaceae bacterium]|nr:hypothetical protein [Flavobacteriaceae bacterium]